MYRVSKLPSYLSPSAAAPAVAAAVVAAGQGEVALRSQESGEAEIDSRL